MDGRCTGKEGALTSPTAAHDVIAPSPTISSSKMEENRLLREYGRDVRDCLENCS